MNDPNNFISSEKPTDFFIDLDWIAIGASIGLMGFGAGLFVGAILLAVQEVKHHYDK